MKNLKQYVEAQRCRKGTADGTNKRGAYWLAIDDVKIRDYGGDGIGDNASDKEHWLSFRHYRSGEVRCLIRKTSWHQNYGSNNSYHRAAIEDCETIEDVVVMLCSITIDDSHAYSSCYKERLTAALRSLGMPESAPAPDEAQDAE